MKKPNKNKIKKRLKIILMLLILIIPLVLVFLRQDICDLGYISTIFILLPIYFLSIFIHEFGHMFFGFLTGYRFLSFQVGRFLIQKTSAKKVSIKRIQANGIGGQCLMIPKDETKEKFFWYNGGGIIFNSIIALTMFSLLLIFKIENRICFQIMYLSLFINYALALINAYPFPGVPNDGFNHRNVKKNKKAFQSILENLQIVSQLNDGLFYQDIVLPEFSETINFRDNQKVFIEILRSFQYLAQDKIDLAYQHLGILYKNRNQIIIIYRNLIDVYYYVLTFLWINQKAAEEIYNSFKKNIKKTLKKETEGIGGIILAYRYFIDNKKIEANKVLNKVRKKIKQSSYFAEVELNRLLLARLEYIMKKMSEPPLIVLASSSPRRKEIMNAANFKFAVLVRSTPEFFNEDITHEDAVMNIALEKAMAVYKVKPNSIVIGADTIVRIDGQILGKPKDKEDAMRMIELLQGQTHEVLTGVAMIYQNDIKTFVEKTEVTFYPMISEEIEEYISMNRVLDKAGSYAIQGEAMKYIKEINGDYNNVVGLPIAKIYQVLISWVGKDKIFKL